MPTCLNLGPILCSINISKQSHQQLIISFRLELFWAGGWGSERKGGCRWRCSGQWLEQAGTNGRSIFDTFLFFFDAPASSWPEQILDMLFKKECNPKNLIFCFMHFLCVPVDVSSCVHRSEDPIRLSTRFSKLLIYNLSYEVAH